MYYRSLLENAGLVMSQRSFHWDISRLYPGLQLRIGPTVNGGLLEFIVDPSKQHDERSHILHEESNGELIMKKKNHRQCELMRGCEFEQLM
jgi:hypothetical protein